MTGRVASGPTPLAAALHVPALLDLYGPEIEKLLEPLTPRERRFVEEYPVDLNGRQAARRAGYSEKSSGHIAYELLRKPKIVDAITAIVAGRSAKTAVNRSWVLNQLVDTHDKVKHKDTSGALTARLKALELIGRHVDVRAFRMGLGFPGGGEDDGADASDIWDLSLLSDNPLPASWRDLSEFEVFERLLSKVTIIKAEAPPAERFDDAGEGATASGFGPEASSGE
jgi:phage terminase small subunit